MSLEDKIKKAFKKDKKLIEANRWSPDLHPNIYELEKFLRKSGYRLVDILEQKGAATPEVIIEPLRKGHLYPEISHDVAEGVFLVKVVSYGMLEKSDLESIIQGYENALGVVNHLQEIDLSDLEIAED